MQAGVRTINNASTQYITDAALRLMKRFGTNDPFEICPALGIMVRFKDLGGVKGMYTSYKRNRFILISSSLLSSEARIVCAHELAHDIFHRKLASNAQLYDTHLNDFSLKPEFEANVFAAELLISDKAVMSNIDVFTSSDALAGELGVSEPLLRLKCAVMKNRGIDIQYSGDFDFNIFE